MHRIQQLSLSYMFRQRYIVNITVYMKDITVELRCLELEGTVKMCLRYRKFEPPRSRNLQREKNLVSDQGHFHYAMITDAQ